MSVFIGERTHHSQGVRLLAETAEEKARAFYDKVEKLLEAGGATSEHAKEIAWCCSLSSTAHQFNLVADDTVLVRMTKAEFEAVKTMLGMEKTPID